MTWSPRSSGRKPHAQHHQASAPRMTNKLRMTPLLPLSNLQRSTVFVDSPCCAVRVECAHDVDGDLGSPVCNDLQSARVCCVGLSEVKVANHDITRHPATCVPEKTFITAARWRKISTTFTRSLASKAAGNCGALGRSTSAASTCTLTVTCVPWN